jgi:hypothetical protein
MIGTHSSRQVKTPIDARGAHQRENVSLAGTRDRQRVRLGWIEIAVHSPGATRRSPSTTRSGWLRK